MVHVRDVLALQRSVGRLLLLLPCGCRWGAAGVAGNVQCGWLLPHPGVDVWGVEHEMRHRRVVARLLQLRVLLLQLNVLLLLALLPGACAPPGQRPGRARGWSCQCRPCRLCCCSW